MANVDTCAARYGSGGRGEQRRGADAVGIDVTAGAVTRESSRRVGSWTVSIALREGVRKEALDEPSRSDERGRSLGALGRRSRANRPLHVDRWCDVGSAREDRRRRRRRQQRRLGRLRRRHPVRGLERPRRRLGARGVGAQRPDAVHVQGTRGRRPPRRVDRGRRRHQRRRLRGHRRGRAAARSQRSELRHGARVVRPRRQRAPHLVRRSARRLVRRLGRLGR